MNNLQENIRRILREELSLRVKRRIDPDEMEKEFLESFDSAYDLTKKRKVLSRHFLDELISTVIIMMMEAFHWRFDSTLPEDEFWYDDIHAELENHYRDRITQMYNEIRGINKSIIKEESNKDILIDGLYDPIYEENGIVLFKEPKHLKVYSKFGIKKSNVISGKEFNKKYVDFKNKKLHKVLYKDGMTLGGNLGEGKYWCPTEYCLSVYLGETHQSSEYSKYVKEVVDFKLGDDLKILVKKHISDDL